jgi:hypothetical protein
MAIIEASMVGTPIKTSPFLARSTLPKQMKITAAEITANMHAKGTSLAKSKGLFSYLLKIDLTPKALF